MRRVKVVFAATVLALCVMTAAFAAGCGGTAGKENYESAEGGESAETGTKMKSEDTGTASAAEDKTELTKPYTNKKPDLKEEEARAFGNPCEAASYDKENSNYTLSINAANQVHGISELLYGIFFEDINFAADGGLYAELIQNRSFEFTKLAAGDEKHAWKDYGNVTNTVITNDSEGRLNENNSNYLIIENAGDEQAGISNTGFLDGIAVTGGANYRFSVYLRGIDGYTGPVRIEILKGNIPLASDTIEGISAEWKKYELTLVPSESCHDNVSLRLTIGKGKVAADMVSLFPEDTYNGRENGLRKALAEKLAELEPAFLRFPGGCVVEGVTLELAYDWKDSIGVGRDGEPLLFNGTYGDVAARKQGQDIWTNENTGNDKYPSYMSYGLGFYEYFLLAEDIGAIGVPVINCGMCCMGQSDGAGPAVGTAAFREYIQDALDLVEFCRGGADTKWGAVRIAMGHEEPFALKYIGIGNEQWGDNFFRHYEAFVEAFAEAGKENPEMYGDIELMFTAGVDDGDSGVDYMAAYERAAEWLADNPGRSIDEYAGCIDHHYYNEPSWFLNHADYYDEDNYGRSTEDMTAKKFGGGINVFLGEYAAQSNTLKAALSEAAYMTGLERNGDIVKMAAYAPLFGNVVATHRAPDLIWFNNYTVTPSVNYYVQKIFAVNAGTALLESRLMGAEEEIEPLSGHVGLGTWNTAASFDNVRVVDNATGSVLAEDDFNSAASADNWYKVSDGKWSISGGRLLQESATTNTNIYGNTGSMVYFGGTDWSNYTFTVEATKESGKEGFLIAFAVGDKDNNYFWNIGGWNNTVSCLQKVGDGAKSGQIGGTVKRLSVKSGTAYALKIVVSDMNVKCYIDDELYVDYTIERSANAESYQVVSTDESGDIIVKLVNVTGSGKTFAVDISGVQGIQSAAEVYLVAGNSLGDDNILGLEEAVCMEQLEVTGITDRFNYTVPKYSVTVLRIKSGSN